MPLLYSVCLLWIADTDEGKLLAGNCAISNCWLHMQRECEVSSVAIHLAIFFFAHHRTSSVALHLSVVPLNVVAVSLHY